MIFLRPIQQQDFEAFKALAALSELPTLPKDAAFLEQKIIHSTRSFQKTVEHPGDELYMFALFDTETKNIVGVSAIQALTGGGEPLYFFRKEQAKENFTIRF